MSRRRKINNAAGTPEQLARAAQHDQAQRTQAQQQHAQARAFAVKSSQELAQIASAVVQELQELRELSVDLGAGQEEIEAIEQEIVSAKRRQHALRVNYVDVLNGVLDEATGAPPKIEAPTTEQVLEVAKS